MKFFKKLFHRHVFENYQVLFQHENKQKSHAKCKCGVEVECLIVNDEIVYMKYIKDGEILSQHSF